MSKHASKKNKNKEENEKLNNFLLETMDIIDKQDENYIFRRRRFMEKFDNLTADFSDKKTVSELKEIAENKSL